MSRYPTLGWLYLHTDRAGGCLVWRGPFNPDGYGLAFVSSNPTRYECAHRAAWRLAGREIPEGHVLHHECRNRACVRVEHLVAMTRREHNLLHRAPGDRCRRDHSDWYVYPSGRRYCRTCKAARNREWEQRQRERSHA